LFSWAFRAGRAL